MLPSSLQNLVNHFSKLPGIGHKTAEKFVFYLLKTNPQELESFAAAIQNLKAEIKLCPTCYNFSESSPCSTCQDPNRDSSLLCVVAEGADILALEKTGEYTGKYFVLGGSINQLDGIGPEHLRFNELLNSLSGVEEIILAFDANMEGETTMMYLAKELRVSTKKITRLARGLPMGSDLEYADEITLSNALSGRREI